MGINFSFLNNKKKLQKVYFGLYVTDLTIHGFAYRMDQKVSRIIGSETSELRSGFEGLNEDVDILLEKLEKSLEHPLEETIFFLHSFMIDPDTYEIKNPYKDILKDLSKALQLKPLGFIDVAEGLSKYLNDKSILNTITIEVNKTKASVTVYKDGRKIFSKYCSISDNFAVDLQNILLEVPRQIILPKEVILYGTTQSSEIAKDLTDFDFDDQIFKSKPHFRYLSPQETESILIDLLTGELASDISSPIYNDPDISRDENYNKESVESLKQSDDTMGFVIGDDVKEFADFDKRDVKIEREYSNEPTYKTYSKSTFSNMFTRIKNIVGRFSSAEKNSMVDTGMQKPIILGVIVAFSVFLVGLVYEYFFHTLELRVLLKTQDYSSELKITLPVSTDKSSDSIAFIKTTAQEFSEEKVATGVRETGEKATGELIFYNYGKEIITLQQGTELKSQSLVFVLNAETKITGRSDSGERGSAKAMATASKIGPEFNIPKNTALTVVSYSDDILEILVEKPFTGGTKKEVSTVSRADLDSLQKKLETKVKTTNANVLGESTDDGELILPDSIEYKITKKGFSSEVGEEAKKVKATINTKSSFIALNKSKVQAEVVKEIKQDVDSSFSVSENETEFDILKSSKNSNNVTISIDTKSKLYKEVSKENIAKDSQFKSSSGLTDRLKSKYDLKEITLKQNMSHGLWTPVFNRNIKVVLE
jgi:hypothetical protein